MGGRRYCAFDIFLSLWSLWCALSALHPSHFSVAFLLFLVLHLSPVSVAPFPFRRCIPPTLALHPFHFRHDDSAMGGTARCFDVTLTHLAYITSSSPRIREIMTIDGGIERLVHILHEFCHHTPTSPNVRHFASNVDATVHRMAPHLTSTCSFVLRRTCRTSTL